MRLKINWASLQHIFTETRLEDVDLSKPQPFMQVLCVYDPRKSKPLTEEWTTQTAIYCDTFWLQSLSLGTRNSSLANAKIYVFVYSFCFVLFSIWGQFPSKSLLELVFGGEIYRRVFCVTSLGGLYLEGLIHGGAYFRNFTVYCQLAAFYRTLRATLYLRRSKKILIR